MIKFATFFLITIFLSTTAITKEKYPFQGGQGFDTKYLWDKNLNGKKKWLLPKKMLKDQFLAKLLAYDKTQFWFTMHDFIATGDFNRDGVQDYVVTVLNLDKQFKAKLDEDQGIYVCKANKDAGACLAEKGVTQHNYQIILGKKETGRAEGKESYWGTGLIQDNLPFIQSGTAQPLIADFNGDGWDDIYLAAAVNDFGTGCGGYHSYFLSQPEGFLKESSETHIGNGKDFNKKYNRICNYSHRADTGDFDKDGDFDIILASIDWKGKNGEMICLINDGKGNMKSSTCGNQFAFIVRHADFDGDGYIDMLAGAHSSDCFKYHSNWKGHQKSSKNRHSLRILWGNGTNKWNTKNSKEIKNVGYHTKTKDNIPLCMPVGTMVADVDNDGDMDLVGSTIGLNYVGGYLITYLNDGKGNFTIGWQQSIHSVTKYNKENWPMSEVNHDENGWYISLHPADINFDGNIDFMVNGHWLNPGNNDVYINNGDGTFKTVSDVDLRKYAKIF